MKTYSCAIFLTLNGKANEAISFYQLVFGGKILFKISNKEFKEKMNPKLNIPQGEEEYISHSIIQINGIQIQIADNPIYEAMEFIEGTIMSLSISTQNIEESKNIYNKILEHRHSQVLLSPTTNEFADFYAVVKDPYGIIIQITNELEPEPSKKGITNS